MPKKTDADWLAEIEELIEKFEAEITDLHTQVVKMKKDLAACRANSRKIEASRQGDQASLEELRTGLASLVDRASSYLRDRNEA